MGDLRSGPSDERGVTAGGTTEPGAPGRTQRARLALRTGGPGRGSAHPRRRPRPGRRLSSLSGCERTQLSTVVGAKGRKPPTCPTRRWDPGMKLAFLPVKVVGYGQSPVAQLRGGKAMERASCRTAYLPRSVCALRKGHGHGFASRRETPETPRGGGQKPRRGTHPLP